MQQVKTEGIILHRVNYGDNDRILTVITLDVGKLNLLAKGVRKQTSKLAGSLELFSTSNLTYIVGRGEINTLISARLIKHYLNIVQDLDRSEWCYGVLKLINKNTEPNSESDIYQLLEATLEALNDRSIKLELTKIWFDLRFLDVMGHKPNLEISADEVNNQQSVKFRFDLDKMIFVADPEGTYSTNHIKILRLADNYTAEKLTKITDIGKWLAELDQLMKLLMISNGYRLG